MTMSVTKIEATNGNVILQEHDRITIISNTTHYLICIILVHDLNR